MVEVMFWLAMSLRRTVLGSSRMACVIVPAAMKGARFCGIRSVSLVAAIWLGKGTGVCAWSFTNGVMCATGIVGFPLVVE